MYVYLRINHDYAIHSGADITDMIIFCAFEAERCVKFYSLKYDIADLDIFCSKSDCHCVEGNIE